MSPGLELQGPLNTRIAVRPGRFGGWPALDTGTSDLSVLFERIAAAADHGRFADAWRFADSARRVAPDNPKVELIHARLQLLRGDARGTAERMQGRNDSDSLMLSAEAAAKAGLWDEARTSCRQLLQRFAVDSLPKLPPLLEFLCRADHRMAGWVGFDSDLRLVGAATGGGVITVSGSLEGEGAPQAIEVAEAVGTAGAPAAFSAALPTLMARTLRVRAGDRELLGSGLPWPPQFDLAGWVVLEDETLHGELRLNWHRCCAPRLLIRCGDTEQTIVLHAPETEAEAASVFSVSLAPLPLGARSLEVAALLPDGSAAPLTGSPIPLPQPNPLPVFDMPGRWTTTPHLDTTPRSEARPRRADARPKINIVIPVYRGLEETLACLRSVLATVPAHLAAVTVVDDASPEEPLRDALRSLREDGRIELLRNPRNLGFPGAVNRGMRMHPERDVVILNADTHVFPGWLERLHAAAYRDERIGTVTPLGEAAAVVSYPADSSSLSHADAATVARIAARVNDAKTIDLPVGVGFCLYVRRDCLDEIGDFDELGFGRGYGEENDLCLRASARGWRHVAALDVFVRHLGGRSFGRLKDLLMARNRRVINYRYPGYDALIQQFLAADPLQASKRALDEERLLQGASKPVLLVSHQLRGGVKRLVDERAAALIAAGHTVLNVHAQLPDGAQGTVQSAAGRAIIEVSGMTLAHLSYDQSEEQAQLRALLLRIGIVAIEFHHFLGLRAAVLEMLAGLGVPYRVLIHDYAWICPRITLLNGSGVYCGEPPLAECERCVKQHGMAWQESVTVEHWRARSARILEGAQRVSAPTRDVRNRMARYFRSLDIDVTPLQAPAAKPRPRQMRSATPPIRGNPGRRVRVAIMGAISTIKGWQLLLDCAKDAAARDLALEFVVIGFSGNNLPLLQTGRVFLTGPYQEHEAAALLEREACDVALFPNVGPETWCYTLTHVLEHGIPIVALDIGAVAERLRDAGAALAGAALAGAAHAGAGILLPLATPPAAINEALLRAADPLANQPIRNKEPSMSTEAESAAPELAATVQILTLPVGLYAFTVQSGATRPAAGLALPALQVAPAPMRSAGTLEFQCGPATLDRWLTQSGDVVTVKVTGGDASLLLTSVRAPDSAVLSIDVKRLDAVAEDAAGTAQAGAAHGAAAAPGAGAADTAAPADGSTRVLTLVHVPHFGDMTFAEGWAGRPTENLWIEGFSIRLAEPHEAPLLEYCGVTEVGDITPWTSSGEFCGTRGTGVPLVAFAVRVHPDAASGYSCAYAGQFLSGTVMGPFADGRLCRSESPGDPLVAIELRLRAESAPAEPGAAEQISA